MKNRTNLDLLLYNYFNKTFKTLYSEKNVLINLIVIIIRLIHVSGIIFLFFGCFFPNKFRDYHIIWCFKTLLLWYIFNGKCYLTMFINYIKNNHQYEEFLPLSSKVVYTNTFLVLIISLIGLMYPEYSGFNLISKAIRSLEKYN